MEEQMTTIPAAHASRLPVYVISWAVIDLMFCIFYVPMVLFLGLAAVMTPDCFFSEIYPPLLTLSFFLIMIFGFWTNIAMLHRKPGAVKLAYLSIGVTVVSILLFIWGIVKDIIGAAAGDEIFFYILIGAGVTCSRMVLLFFYYLAIKKAKVFFAGQDPNPYLH